MGKGKEGRSASCKEVNVTLRQNTHIIDVNCVLFRELRELCPEEGKRFHSVTTMKRTCQLLVSEYQTMIV